MKEKENNFFKNMSSRHLNFYTESDSSLNITQEKCIINNCREEIKNGKSKDDIIEKLKIFMMVSQTGGRNYGIIKEYIKELIAEKIKEVKIKEGEIELKGKEI